MCIAVDVSIPDSAKFFSTPDFNSGPAFACANVVAAMMIFPCLKVIAFIVPYRDLQFKHIVMT